MDCDVVHDDGWCHLSDAAAAPRDMSYIYHWTYLLLGKGPMSGGVPSIACRHVWNGPHS
jgi:hypothetical protein